MRGKKVVHSKSTPESDCWTTPRDLFVDLYREFIFTIDGAASKENALLPQYWTEQDDALKQDWGRERVFCNPPYSKWQKFVVHGARCGGFCVFLLPARTDTVAFHEYIWQKPNVEVRFVRGRLKFGGAKHGAPFPSMIVIFNDE